MRKRLLAFLVSLTVLLGVMPGLPVFAEEFIDITFHFGTIENPDVIDPVVISVTTGTQYGEITSSPKYQAAVASLSEALNLDGLQFFNYATKRSLKDIGSWDGFKETDSTLIDDRFTENTVLYETALLPITSAEATIASPVCGTSSETKPEVTVPSGKGYGVCIYEEETMANWFDPDATGEEPYKVTFEGGKTYHAWFDLEANLGYYFQIPKDGSTVTVNNGTKGSCECYERMCNVEVTVTAEHNLGDWDIVRVETDKEDGLMRRTCSGCELSIEEAIPKLDSDNTYECVSGDAQVVTLGSASDLVARFKASENDDQTYDKFVSVSVTHIPSGNVTEMSRADADGKSNAAGVYLVGPIDRIVGRADAGSVIITLYASYLETLEPGDYMLTVYFEDGKTATSKFTLSPAAAEAATKSGTAVPATGEDVSYTMILGGALVCISVLGVALFLDKKRLGKKDVK